MFRFRSTGLVRVLPVALVLAALLPNTGGAPAQERNTRQSLLFGRTAVEAPERSDAGEWPGTWYYVSRDRKMALWIRDRNGTPEVKLRMRGKMSEAENFSTDWNGKAEYESTGNVAKFELQFDERDADTMTGRWIWEVTRGDDGRRETAQFTVYRAGWGRQMVWVLENLRTESWGRREGVIEQPLMVWTFQKASRREALWEELPF